MPAGPSKDPGIDKEDDIMTRVQRIAALLLLWPLLSGAGLLVPNARAENLPVAPFEARYTVYAKGMPAGESILTLTEIGAGRYRMRSEVYPTGLAALLVSERLSERAEGNNSASAAASRPPFVLISIGKKARCGPAAMTSRRPCP
jgi:hypothetical protein